MEKELLMVLEEFCSMLFGFKLFTYTNHKNLTFANLNCCIALFLHSFVEEYGPTILYHPAKKNVIADTFSCFPCCDVLPILVGENDLLFLFNFAFEGLDISNDPNLLDCFISLILSSVTDNNPVDLKWIHNHKM